MGSPDGPVSRIRGVIPRIWVRTISRYWHSWREGGVQKMATWRGRGTAIAKSSALRSSRTARGLRRASFCRDPPRLAAETAGDMGGRLKDHDSTATTHLEEAVESQPRPEWYAFSLKLEYLDWMRDLEKTRHPDPNALEEEWTYRVGDMELPLTLTRFHYLAQRFLMREPERSCRATRLLFANWLAEVESSELPRRKPAARAFFITPGTPTAFGSIPSIPRRRPIPKCCHRTSWRAGSSPPPTSS